MLLPPLNAINPPFSAINLQRASYRARVLRREIVVRVFNSCRICQSRLRGSVPVTVSQNP
jgi:hypothetical protein